MIVRNPLGSEPPRGRWLAAGTLALLALPAWSVGQEPARPAEAQDQPAGETRRTDVAREIQGALAEVQREVPRTLEELRRELPQALAEVRRELPLAAPLLARIGQALAANPEGQAQAPTDLLVVAEVAAEDDAKEDTPGDRKPLDAEQKARLEQATDRLRAAQARMQKRQAELSAIHEKLTAQMQREIARIQAEMARSEQQLKQQFDEDSAELRRAAQQQAELLKDLRVQGFQLPADAESRTVTVTVDGRSFNARRTPDGEIQVEGRPLPPGERRVEGRPLPPGPRRVEGRALRPGDRYRADVAPPVPPEPPVPPASPLTPRVFYANPGAREPLDPKVLEVLKSSGLLLKDPDTGLNQRVDRLEQKFDTLLEELRSMRKDLKAGDKP